MNRKKPLKNSKEYRARRMSKEQNEHFALKLQLHKFQKKLKNMLVDKEQITQNMNKCIEAIIDCFRTYDTIMLLGGIGLRLLDNLPNIEKHFLSQMTGQAMDTDENSEVVAEYALNFGLSVPNEYREVPDESIINDLYQYLKDLKIAFSQLEQPENKDDSEGWFSFFSHSETIAVRGDGYMIHIEQVYKELFFPHTRFFEQNFGFSIHSFFEFCTNIETRIYSKIGNSNSIWGAYKAWERWKDWTEKEYGAFDTIEDLNSLKVERHFIKGFLEDNPDMKDTTTNSDFLVLYEPTDYKNSDKIFWIVPQNEEEEKILETICSKFGDNSSFISEGPYKGNIMQDTTIFERPIIKEDGKYFCFTPMLLYRNLFVITEGIMKRCPDYYETYFRNNTHIIARDNYIERKVKEQLELFLPTVTFYSSCHYTKDGIQTELDILGSSESATFLIEVKAHELSHKNKVRTGTLKSKFKDSVTEACFQCHRAKEYIISSPNPQFGSNGITIKIDPNKPIYKLAITFQHYSSLLGDIEILKNLGLMKDEYEDTWIVSLFDLMVVADYCSDEAEFIDYLQMHNEIQSRNIKWTDELVLFEGYINQDLKHKIKKQSKLSFIFGDTEYFDRDYANIPDIKI